MGVYITDTTPPSNLLSNSEQVRNDLINRNLYTPNTEYPLNDDNAIQRSIDAISSITSLLTPFKSYNLKNTVLGRSITNNTPLTEIGLAMLGKQFALNVSSRVSNEIIPEINLSNAFDGSKDTKVFTQHIDYAITKKPANSFIEKLNNFLNSITYNYSSNDNPFNKYSTNSNYIQNTGKAQLNLLFQQLNQNLYKAGFSTSAEDAVILQASIDSGTKLTDKSTVISTKSGMYDSYYNFYANPYNTLYVKDESINIAELSNFYHLSTLAGTQEYAPNTLYVDSNFGVTSKEVIQRNINPNTNEWIDEYTEFNLKNNIAWGRDGIESETNSILNNLRGNTDDVLSNTITPSDLSGFNVKTGLLEYTRNLLTASEGQYIDITRKAFTKNKKIVGFNGSALWVSNDSAYVINNNTSKKTGIRQHSVLDQYNKFSKAIRFNGNLVYGGNENSVISNNILPRIHPTYNEKDGKINNRNLMFSIENLAAKTNGEGFLENGIQIPQCEIGQFGGRLMWFPPYDISINEASSSKFEPTVMIGRSEPMYSYMYTERSATLSFTLLVDYPIQLKNLKGSNKHREIAEFFSFGGDPYDPNNTSTNNDKNKASISAQKEEITGNNDTVEDETLSFNDIFSVFPNAFPNTSQVDTAFDVLFKNLQYEIATGCKQNIQIKTSGSGLNSYIYYTEDNFFEGDPRFSYDSPNKLHLVIDNLPVGFSQYTSTGSTISGDLNDMLYKAFNKEENRNLYDINIIGEASLPGKEPDNQLLGQRRADAMKKLIESRLKSMFGKSVQELGITINSSSNGSNNATSKDSIESLNTKLDRKATVSIIRNSNQPPKKEVKITPNDQSAIDTLNESAAIVDNKLKNLDCLLSERDINDGILDSFKSVSDNKFYPVFHSQTPEDFHKRLTFLQQCTRQGYPIKYDSSLTNNNVGIKNSVFGRQPISILRFGDFIFTKVIIENLTIDYSDAPWDLNPEGFGLQPMMAKVTLQMKVLGGESLEGPVNALQNAISFNYYANSTFRDNITNK